MAERGSVLVRVQRFPLTLCGFLTGIRNAFNYNTITLADPRLRKEVLTRSMKLKDTLEPAVLALQAMIRQLEHEFEVACRRARQISFMCGLASLPNEVLRRVMEVAVCEAQGRGPLVAITLSHVCRSFRDLVMDSPSLWVTFDVSQFQHLPSTKLLSVCMARSRNLPLDIRMSFDSGAFSCRNERNRCYLSILARHSQRWRRFEADFIETDPLESIHSLQETLNLKVPRLEHLVINSRRPRTSDSENVDIEQSSVITSWHAPKLRTLCAFNHLPFPSEPATELDVARIHFNFKSRWTTYLLFNGLRLLSSLSQLTLVIHQTMPFDRQATIVPVALKSVQTYHVELRSVRDQRLLLPNTLAAVLGAIHCPNARRLSLEIEGCSCAFVQIAVPAMLSTILGHSYPVLSDLTLSITPFRNVDVVFHLPLESTPNLRRLSMSITSQFEISLSRCDPGNLLEKLHITNPYPKNVARWLRTFTGGPPETRQWPFKTLTFECTPVHASRKKVASPTTMEVLECDEVASWCRRLINPYFRD